MVVGLYSTERYFRGRLSNFNQSEARNQCFLASEVLIGQQSLTICNDKFDSKIERTRSDSKEDDKSDDSSG